MKALILTTGGIISAKILSTWISSGNSVAALWIGSINPERFLRRDRALGNVMPSWSIWALARRYGVPVHCNSELSSWVEADVAIKRLRADVLITAMTHQIVPQNILGLFSGRAVNFHPAVLPHYRGPNPRAGMILDGKGALYGGVTLHCLSREIDKGDIIGVRVVPYDPDRGFIYWNVSQARAAGDLVEKELKDYLRGTLIPHPQSALNGNYRKVDSSEVTLSENHSASRTKWLCDQLGASGWIRFSQSDNEKPSVVCRFIRSVGPRQFGAARISRFAFEFDAADARVRVARRSYWVLTVHFVMYLLAIIRTRL
jgi:methionyl-tRNA formyltransferase